jgi:hypothetical protein
MYPRRRESIDEKNTFVPAIPHKKKINIHHRTGSQKIG